MPTLEEFTPRFVEGQAEANRHKPSSIAAKKMVLRVHLIPNLGSRPLDEIKSEDVQHLKHSLRMKAVKTVNNVLTVLNVLLKTAVEWAVIKRMPCTIRLLPVPKAVSSLSRLRRVRAAGGASMWERHANPRRDSLGR